MYVDIEIKGEKKYLDEIFDYHFIN